MRFLPPMSGAAECFMFIRKIESLNTVKKGGNMRNELTITEANNKPLVNNHQFQIGDIVYTNNYGEPYYGTEKQWRNMDARDAGFSAPEYPEDSFSQNSEWFTEFEIIREEDEG